MATASDLKVGDVFILADDGYFSNLLLNRENIGRPLTVVSIDDTRGHRSRRITLGGAIISAPSHNYRHFGPEYPVTIIEQEQAMPIAAFASHLRVGDVFTLADGIDTSPLFIGNYVGYHSGMHLHVVGDIVPYDQRNGRRIRFTQGSGGHEHSKFFNNEHVVNIVRRANDLSASALEEAPAPTEAPEIPPGLYPALPYGTPVTFTPASGIGQGFDTGTVGAARWIEGLWSYEITTADGHSIYRSDRGGESVVPTPESAPVTEASNPTPEAPRQVIPRTSEAAKAMLTIGSEFLDADTIEALKRLALYLPGGRAEVGGNELAVRKDLCIQYEAIVCPQLGWAGREHMREHLYSSQNPQNWLDDVEAFERANAGADAPSMIRGFARRYARGGAVNDAIVSHMESHLEEEKYEATNQVLDALGLDGIEVTTEKEYRVTVRLERQVTVTEYQYVSTTVFATDADAAHADVSVNILMADHADASDWEQDTYTFDFGDVEENWEYSETEEV